MHYQGFTRVASDTTIKKTTNVVEQRRLVAWQQNISLRAQERNGKGFEDILQEFEKLLKLFDFYAIIYLLQIYRHAFIMEFNQKLQELRKNKGLTQEELASSLYVSRTAISKWESGRGYPNIDSLKAIAKFFSITLDELLSTDEMLTIAEEDTKRKEKHFRDLVYGLLDLSMAMLLFLPLFAEKTSGIIQSVSLMALCGVQPYLKIAYYTLILLVTAMGILTLALQNCTVSIWLKSKTMLSLILSVVSILLFIISLQPYPAVFAFVLLAMKIFMLIKWQ